MAPLHDGLHVGQCSAEERRSRRSAILRRSGTFFTYSSGLGLLDCRAVAVARRRASRARLMRGRRATPPLDRRRAGALATPPNCGG